MKAFGSVSMYDHEYDHIIERRQRRDNERINLNTIKQAIDRKLATPQKSRLYWNSLTLFLKTKLSKFEWDHIVKVLLGPDFVPLHNYFIRSLFFNARSTSSIPLKEPTKPIDHVLYKKSEKKKDLILRNRIIDTSNLEPISMDPYSFPDQNILSARMNRIAMDAGLLVSNDCVTLVQRALATHLKNILAKMIRMKVGNINEELVELRRTSPEVGSFLMGKSPFNVPDVVHSYVHYLDDISYMRNSNARGISYDEEEEKENVNVNPDRFILTPRDMYTALQCSPNLIQSERIRERVAMSDWDLYN